MKLMIGYSSRTRTRIFAFRAQRSAIELKSIKMAGVPGFEPGLRVLETRVLAVTLYP
jgi:hypothetical protein